MFIHTNSKEELEISEKDINAKCEGKLEANTHKLRNPRLVMLNIPEEISIGNVEDTLLAQNTDFCLKQGDIAGKFSYETKKNTRNLVIEVSAQTGKLLLHRRVKLFWQICKIEDYVVATRCYKCSRYNHRARDCRGDVTCPLCAGNHIPKECTTNPQEHICINCLSYNKQSEEHNLRKSHFTGQKLPKLACDSREEQENHRLLK
jgi:hypothetical protein